MEEMDIPFLPFLVFMQYLRRRKLLVCIKMGNSQHHTNKSVASEAVLGVTLLLCGCAVYLLFRSKSVNIYQWASAIGLADTIDSVRDKVQFWSVSDFIKYSLPDGLYCMAYMLIVDAVWHNSRDASAKAAILFVPCAAVCNEMLQYLRWAKGTFDGYDLVCYAFPLLLYIFVNSHVSYQLSINKRV